MLDNILQEIMDKFPAEREKSFSGNYLAETIRIEIPQIFKSYFPSRENLIWQASPGQGNWADAPWIAILNPLITNSPQEGYYPVYLFDYSLSIVYLSLNQGVTKIREEFKAKEARGILINRSEIIRHRISPEFQSLFSSDPIKLGSDKPGSLLRWYEIGHIVGKGYEKGNIPTTDVLISDLSEMLKLYDLSLARGGWEGFDQIDSDLESNDQSLEEKRRIRFHKVIERNQRLAKEAKKIHGYKCEACGFDFEQVYGEIGEDFIEAHHKTPISRLPLDGSIRLSPRDDFVVLCSNCHSMIHRKNAPIEFEDFIELVNERKPS